MRLLYTLIFVMASCVVLFGQSTGSVSGTIKTSDENPAEYVNVSLKGTSKGAVADKNGKFEIRNVTPGNYTLVASFVGLQKQERPIEVKAGEVTSVDFVLNENSEKLQEIIVSADRDSFIEPDPSPSLRLNTPIIETPQNIQVITGDALRTQQVISMSDGLIRNVSGVVRSEHWADLYTNISARGSQLHAFRNGFNVVNSYWGPLTEDMSFVENIEFVKGPAGFMLSSGDPSGLYNVVTKKPTGVTKGEVSMTAGSYGLFRTTVDLDGKLSKTGRLLYRLNMAAQNRNSFRANEYNDRYVIAPVLSYQLDDDTKVTLEYNYQRANMSNVGSFYVFHKDGFAQTPQDFTMLPAGTEGLKINDHSLYVNLQHHFDDNWKITAQVAQFLYNQTGTSMWLTSANPDGTYIRYIGVWDAESTMSMAQVFVNGDVTTGPVRHRILAGIDVARKEYMADWGQSHDLDTAEEPFDPNNPYLGIPVTGFPQFDRETPLEQRAQMAGGLQDQRYSSIYIQDELGFLDNKIRLTLAGRYTDLYQYYYGAEEDDHFTPRVGLSASINKELAVYALYDQAFVPQTGVMANGNKVQPLTGNNMEVGVKKDWFGGWNTTLSVYRILKNNELTADPTNPNSGLSIELGQKRSQGIEFDLRGTILPGLNLVANYAYTDSKVVEVAEGVTYPEEGSVVPGFSKHTANAWLTYKIQTGVLNGLGFSAGYTALLDRATYWEASPDPDKEMDDYFKLDAGLFWEKNKLRVAVNMFNVLDEYLYSGSYDSWTSMYTYQAEAPRNTRLSINYRF